MELSKSDAHSSTKVIQEENTGIEIIEDFANNLILFPQAVFGLALFIVVIISLLKLNLNWK